MKNLMKEILLVEDNLSDIELTKRAFQKSHVLNPIVVCEDGQEAIDYFTGSGRFEGRDLENTPAVVLLDINLPILNGHEVLKWIRTNTKTRRQLVVMLTSSKEEQDLAKSYDLGVNSYIRKPIDSDQFYECIRQLGLYWLIINENPPKV